MRISNLTNSFAVVLALTLAVPAIGCASPTEEDAQSESIASSNDTETEPGQVIADADAGATVSLMQHKDNPTQIRIGDPIP